jgi:hypothetical protein
MKTIEYHGVVRRVMAGRVEVKIESSSASEPGPPSDQIGRTVSVKCAGKIIRAGERVTLTETVIGQGQVMIFGLFLPVMICVAIYFVFRQVTQGDGRVSLTLAAVFLFPYYSILLLMLKYFRKEHAFRLKQ